jgi:hypothetical protein
VHYRGAGVIGNAPAFQAGVTGSFPVPRSIPEIGLPITDLKEPYVWAKPKPKRIAPRPKKRKVVAAKRPPKGIALSNDWDTITLEPERRPLFKRGGLHKPRSGIVQ